jgi:hypothetical protein
MKPDVDAAIERAGGRDKVPDLDPNIPTLLCAFATLEEKLKSI